MKKLTIIVLSIILLFSILNLTVFVDAQSEIRVKVNGNLVSFDQSPIIDSNNRTLVPLRFVSEKLGAEVDWNDTTQTVTITKGRQVITLVIGKRTATIDGKTYQLDTKAILKNGRTLVPVRFISEALGTKVEWESKTNTVLINETDEEEVKITYPQIPASNLEMNDLVRSLPSFEGNTTIGDFFVLVNLKGTNNWEDSTISIEVSEQPQKMATRDFTYKYYVELPLELNKDEQAFVQDLLQVFYPTSYGKIMTYIENKETIIITLDNRPLYVEIVSNGIKLRIGE